MEEREKVDALKEVCRSIAGFSNAIGSDFHGITACEIEHDFSQGKGGLLIQFAISNHAIGKAVRSQAEADAFNALRKIAQQDEDGK